MAAAGSLSRLARGHLGCGLTHKTWGVCCWLTIPLLLCSQFLVTMAHESWKQESEETGEAPIQCINNCGFFGSSMTNKMCSKCYKDFIKLHDAPAAAAAEAVVDNKQAEEAAAQEQQQPPNPKPPSNRCLSCRKKVGLTGFQCRCGGTFCSTHRYTDSHQCTFDYKTAAREQIAKQNPVVMADKINKI
ncbi:hypothetical protein BDA96_02G045800 [Sorghum bicolor]|uniref:AN1-type domain-containing protein n=2 Tax=Sorghum bicolor TaxID=4558 RepID=A0A921URE3_SORBI|nr:zinc finger A20 and AN1 domain-containing stress-associated protein 9-like [Sorghum bicolor]KAG0541767.1 hypothetical protein BDA96_02G045800 [Sorghum bicolor]OQU88500.1 hypothetical protein SORBI_3002G046000 [Sorghum bicolor]|eukprot:XP_021310273.1 zinc finger A20 and AN1 domain-containing stress-associated protein 9-like [Sorghum bicolor]